MRRNRFFAALRMTVGAIAGLVALGSCSVKEDRSDCPCWLTVEAESTATLTGWYGSQRIFDGHKGGFVDRMVPRGDVAIISSRGEFTVAEGRQMDELFAELLHVDTDGEKAFAKVQLKKQFATVTLDFKESEDGRTDYDIIVKGNIQGADFKTLEPKDGPFRCIPEAAPERGYQFRVPRQKDNSLMAELWSEDALVDTIPVGELIAKARFDWKRESLGDIRILADLPAKTFTITVMEWEGPVTFEITI